MQNYSTQISECAVNIFCGNTFLIFSLFSRHLGLEHAGIIISGEVDDGTSNRGHIAIGGRIHRWSSTGVSVDVASAPAPLAPPGTPRGLSAMVGGSVIFDAQVPDMVVFR